MIERIYTGCRDDVTTYFSGKTEIYDRHRPGYPPEAIDWVLHDLGTKPMVADIGCGTGISSRALAAAGAYVIGIEPNDDMRRQAREQVQAAEQASVDYRPGTGEQTSLEEASLDCVVCAQAFHWFDAPAALREFHRILKPAGRLAFLWNKRDEAVPASAEYERIIHHAMDLAEAAGRVVARFRAAPELGPLFQQQSVTRFDNPVAYTFDALIGRARSSSYWPESGENRDVLEGELAALFGRHHRGNEIALAQFTEVTLAHASPRMRGSCDGAVRGGSPAT